MKKLISLFVGVALATMLTTSAFGQAAGPTGGGVKDQGTTQGKKKNGARSPIAPKMLKQLNLTPDQAKQIKELASNFAQQREKLAQGGAKPKAKELAPLRKQFLEDLSKVLTPEQKTKLKELMAEARNKNKKKKDGATTGTATGSGTGTGTGTGTGGAKTGGGL